MYLECTECSIKQSVPTAAPCSQSCELFWSISSWSLPAPSSSGGCASAVSPSSVASHPRASDYTAFMSCFLVVFIFSPFRMWHKLWWGQTFPSAEGPVFLNVNFIVCAPNSLYSRTVQDQPVMHRSLFFFFRFLMWPHWSSGLPSFCCSLKGHRHQLCSVCISCYSFPLISLFIN